MWYLRSHSYYTLDMSTTQYKAMVTKNLKMMFPHIAQQEMKMIVECIFKLVAATDNAALAEPVEKIQPKPLTPGQQKKKDQEVAYRANQKQNKKQQAADRNKELPKEREPPEVSPDRARPDR